MGRLTMYSHCLLFSVAVESSDKLSDEEINGCHIERN